MLSLARLVLEAAACADAARTRALMTMAERAGATMASRSRLRGASLALAMSEVIVLRQRVLALVDGAADERRRAEEAIDALLVGVVGAYGALPVSRSRSAPA